MEFGNGPLAVGNERPDRPELGLTLELPTRNEAINLPANSQLPSANHQWSTASSQAALLTAVAAFVADCGGLL